MMLTPKGEDSLTCHWDGPYPVKKVLGEQTYLIDAPYKGRRGKRCHHDLLKRYFAHVLSNTLILAADWWPSVDHLRYFGRTRRVRGEVAEYTSG